MWFVQGTKTTEPEYFLVGQRNAGHTVFRQNNHECFRIFDSHVGYTTSAISIFYKITITPVSPTTDLFGQLFVVQSDFFEIIGPRINRLFPSLSFISLMDLSEIVTRIRFIRHRKCRYKTTILYSCFGKSYLIKVIPMYKIQCFNFFYDSSQFRYTKMMKIIGFKIRKFLKRSCHSFF